MGRGGYLGGSTIIYPGSDWFSGVVKREPSATKARRRRVTTNNCSSEGLAFLERVVRAELDRKTIPEVSSTMSEELRVEIRRAGGPLEWAKTRKEYRRLKELRASKPGKGRHPKSAGDGASVKKQKTPAEARRAEIRHSYIAGILAADRKGRPLPDRPRVLRAELSELGSERVDIVSWAQRQPEARLIKGSAQPIPQGATPLDKARIAYLKAVAASITRQQPLPGVPKNVASLLAPALAPFDDVGAWARAQPEYEALAARALRKTGKVAPTTPPSTAAAAGRVARTQHQPIKPSRRTGTLSPEKAREIRTRILVELQKACPAASVAATIKAEELAWSALQAEASRRLGVSPKVDIRLFPAYLAIYQDIRAALRARRG
jgi:hypothetical protein